MPNELDEKISKHYYQRIPEANQPNIRNRRMFWISPDLNRNRSPERKECYPENLSALSAI